MTAKTKNLDAEVARVAAEYETAVAELATAEATAQEEMHQLAGQQALGELPQEKAGERLSGLWVGKELGNRAGNPRKMA